MSEEETKEELIEVSTQEIADGLGAINECIINLGERLKAIEEYVQELSPASKIYYKPPGHEEYLNLKENFDEIYKRLNDGL
jgi:hypothetical protein